MGGFLFPPQCFLSSLLLSQGAASRGRTPQNPLHLTSRDFKGLTMLLFPCSTLCPTFNAITHRSLRAPLRPVGSDFQQGFSDAGLPPKGRVAGTKLRNWSPELDSGTGRLELDSGTGLRNWTPELAWQRGAGESTPRHFGRCELFFRQKEVKIQGRSPFISYQTQSIQILFCAFPACFCPEGTLELMFVF